MQESLRNAESCHEKKCWGCSQGKVGGRSFCHIIFTNSMKTECYLHRVTVYQLWTLCVIEAKKSISSRHVAMAMKLFLDNAIDSGNHHTKFEIHLINC